MKYLVLIGDGMSDLPVKELNGKTPLAVARTPNLDYLAQNGTCGWVKNVPPGMNPGSDVAAMSLFGYDPHKYYSGRGPLEAASLKVNLKPGEIAFRCNLVSVKKGKMHDFTADHISTEEAKKIFIVLNREMGSKEIKFYPGLSYRNLLVVSSKLLVVSCKTTAPHDITGKKIGPFLPRGKGCEILLKLMNESEVILHQMKSKATIIWPWSPGAKPAMPAFRRRFRKKAAVITAVHLLKGLGRILGMEIIEVPGATGYLDTNYLGKAQYALKALKNNDVVFVHVEAPDEAGHEGDVRKKIKAIEDFDRLVVGTILNNLKLQTSNYKLLVLPDHPTPIRYMTHTRDAVPFMIWGKGIEGSRDQGIKGYNEKEIGKSKLSIRHGYKLLETFLKD